MFLKTLKKNLPVVLASSTHAEKNGTVTSHVFLFLSKECHNRKTYLQRGALLSTSQVGSTASCSVQTPSSVTDVRERSSVS